MIPKLLPSLTVRRDSFLHVLCLIPRLHASVLLLSFFSVSLIAIEKHLTAGTGDHRRFRPCSLPTLARQMRDTHLYKSITSAPGLMQHLVTNGMTWPPKQLDVAEKTAVHAQSSVLGKFLTPISEAQHAWGEVRAPFEERGYIRPIQCRWAIDRLEELERHIRNHSGSYLCSPQRSRTPRSIGAKMKESMVTPIAIITTMTAITCAASFRSRPVCSRFPRLNVK